MLYICCSGHFGGWYRCSLIPAVFMSSATIVVSCVSARYNVPVWNEPIACPLALLLISGTGFLENPHPNNFVFDAMLPWVLLSNTPAIVSSPSNARVDTSFYNLSTFVSFKLCCLHTYCSTCKISGGLVWLLVWTFLSKPLLESDSKTVQRCTLATDLFTKTFVSKLCFF